MKILQTFCYFLFGYPKTIKFRDLQCNLTGKKFYFDRFCFIGQFFFEHDIFKLQEVFSECGIRALLEKGLVSFQIFLILQIWDKPDVLKTFQIQFWKQDIKPKKPRILLFRKIPCGLFSRPLRGHFQCFWKIYWGLSQELDVL
jgi:hypothetical protein